jgi:dTDP-4-amino-4,6-dideoxygalactose transaminase
MIHAFGSSMGLGEFLRIGDSIANNWTGAGPKVDQFEREFAAFRGLEDFVMVSSGSSALHLAVHLLDLPSQSDVIVPSFTWVACAQAVALCGHRPVFCDVDPSTQNVTVETVKKALTSKTKAVMVVHYAGRPVNIDPILSLGFPVIEDAAHAVVSDFSDGKPCGAKGTVGIFSFDAVKNLACPEGGGLTASSILCRKARNLRYCGVEKSGFAAAGNADHRWWEHAVNGVFPKILCNDVCASIALEQLRRLPDLQKRRDRVYDVYMDELLPMAAVGFVKLPHGLSPSHSRFTFFIRCERRDQLARFLKIRGVYTTLRYSPLHRVPLYGQQDVSLPNTEALADNGLNIPLHPGMTQEDAHWIVNSIYEFYEKRQDGDSDTNRSLTPF